MASAAYELRTPRGNPVIAFDDEQRAIAECLRRTNQYGAKLSVWRVTKVEERVG